MSGKKVHRVLWQVLPKDGLFGWKLVRDGKFVRSYLTQNRAIKEAQLCQEYEWDCYRYPSELQIHDKHGKVREKNTFPRSTDPAEIEG